MPLLSDLINAIRHPEPAIEVVEIRNPRIEPDELLGKYIILDILARDAQGYFYNMEMQVRRRLDWSARSAYYLAKALTDQLKSGDAYSELKPVIGIHLLDFELRDRVRPDIRLGRELQLNIIELPKADRLGMAAGGLAAWVAYFKHWREETTMNQITYPPVQQALTHLRALSADDEARRLAFVRERALHDEISELQGARREGIQQGEALVLERLLVKRFGVLPDEVHQRLAQANTDQLEVWTDHLLDAPTLNAVFESH